MSLQSSIANYMASSATLYRLVIVCTILAVVHAANFTQCAADFQSIFNNSTNETKSDLAKYIWERRPRHLKSTNIPFLMTLDGCYKFCGADPQYYGPYIAFATVTTWILPVLALVTQLPFESSKTNKLHILQSLLYWCGSPAIAIGTTLFNIHCISKCASYTTLNNRKMNRRNRIFYVLSVLNQYQYPTITDNICAIDRDEALFYGLFHPLSQEDDQSVAKSRDLITMLAFQLRMSRRKMVYPVAITIIWFLIAFIFSVVLAFGQEIGDRKTAQGYTLTIYIFKLICNTNLVYAIVSLLVFCFPGCQS